MKITKLPPITSLNLKLPELPTSLTKTTVLPISPKKQGGERKLWFTGIKDVEREFFNKIVR